MKPLKVLHVRRNRAMDPTTLLGAQPTSHGEYSTLIRQSTLVYDDDAECVTLVYLASIEEDCSYLRAALRRLAIAEQDRMSGVVSRSAVFGYTPRNAFRQHPYCNSAELAIRASRTHDLVCSFAPVVARYYATYGPGVYGAHEHLSEQVLPEWTIEASPFTSGVINRDSAIPYHYDSGNFKHVWSNMLALRHGVSGGYLVLPEYDLALAIGDKSLTMFDGQGLLHGVSPFHQTQEDGYRITVVYYSLEKMWHCKTFEEELKQAQARD